MGFFFDRIQAPKSLWQGDEEKRQRLVKKWKSMRSKWKRVAFGWRLLGFGVFRLDRWAGCDEGVETCDDFLRHLGAA